MAGLFKLECEGSRIISLCLKDCMLTNKRLRKRGSAQKSCWRNNNNVLTATFQGGVR